MRPRLPQHICEHVQSVCLNMVHSTLNIEKWTEFTKEQRAFMIADMITSHRSQGMNLELLVQSLFGMIASGMLQPDEEFREALDGANRDLNCMRGLSNIRKGYQEKLGVKR